MTHLRVQHSKYSSVRCIYIISNHFLKNLETILYVYSIKQLATS